MPPSHTQWQPDAWLSDLKQQLQVAGEGYLRRVECEDHDEELEHLPGIRSNRTSFALLAVSTVMNKLAELPGMRDHVGLMPLHNLVAALWDLGQGGKPALLQLVPGVGKGGEHVAGRWVRQHALLFLAILEASGISGREACQLVADALAAVGHLGRKRIEGQRQPLSPKTVADWRTKSRQRTFKQSDQLTATFLDRNLTRLRRGTWPLSKEAAITMVTAMSQSPLISSKI